MGELRLPHSSLGSTSGWNTLQWLVLSLHQSLFLLPKTMQRFIEQQTDFDENTDGLVIQTSQAIPDSFLRDLKEERFESKHRKAGEYMRVASIPVVVVDKWKREGFDFDNAPVREIITKLKMEGLDAFITTDKAI